MFQSIRNFFLGKKQLNVVTWSDVVWKGGSNPFLTTEDFGIPFPKSTEKEAPMLTQSELQMLQRIVANHIRIHEQVRKEIKYEAQEYPHGSEERQYVFRQHREIKQHLKKLSTLQYRLKHKIAARG